MALVRRGGTAFAIDGSVGSVVLGLGAAEAAAGSHDHSVTGVGATGVATPYRGGTIESVTAVNDAAYVVLAGDHVVGYTALSAPRNVTLPGDAPLGRVVWVVDLVGNAGVYAITIAAASGTIDGLASTSVATTYGAVELISTGTHWVIRSRKS
jgi:hypothetical protein